MTSGEWRVSCRLVRSRAFRAHEQARHPTLATRREIVLFDKGRVLGFLRARWPIAARNINVTAAMGEALGDGSLNLAIAIMMG